MIFTANKLWTLNIPENPTIFYIVDRIELEEQLRNEYEALETALPNLERIESIKELLETLKLGKRGVFLTLIHKFRPEEIKTLIEELEKLSESTEEETILTRKNIIAFIDEGHRTQYGLLAAAMRCALKNAFFFAFTGTPIAKGKRDTYAYFAYPEMNEYYLHRYFITESQKDRHTIPIAFTTRLLDRVGLKYNREVRQEYQTFLDTETFEDTEDRLDPTSYKELIDFLVERGALKEVPEEYRLKVSEGIKNKMTKIKVFMEKTDRIQTIAQDIAQHFKENVDGKFKAMIAAASRLSCVRYKKAVDQALRKLGIPNPEQYTEIVMTYTQNDPEEIASYEQQLRERYGRGKEAFEINKEIIAKFKEEEYPKIVIVTDMLITGFDHPQLQTIYLDKPLKGHMLGDGGHETEAHDRHETAHAFKIRLRRLDGGYVTVEELLREGRPVLLIFFAIWCPTCSKNISTLWRAYQRFGGKVNALLSSFDPGDTPGKINNFLTSHSVGGGWIVTEPNLDFLVMLQVITQETIFGISSSGEIVYEKRFGTLTEDEWLRIVEKLS